MQVESKETSYIFLNSEYRHSAIILTKITCIYVGLPFEFEVHASNNPTATKL